MSSNDPPPTGKFRPRKKAPPRTASSSGSRITPGAAATGAAATTVDAGASATGDTSASRPGRGGRGRTSSSRSRSPGAGRGGRGRGRRGGGGRGGRGAGRGGRFVMPQGRAFFTGGQAGDQAMAAAASGASPATVGSSSAAGAGAGPGSAASSSRTVRPGADGSSRSRSPARGRRRSGLEEGDETVLGEIEGGGVGGAGLAESGKIGKVESALPGPSGGGGRESQVLFGDDEDDAPAASTARVGSRKSAGDDAYMYDSDSSDDEMRKGVSEPAWSSLAPVQLPLPPPRKHILYDCQRGENASAATSATTVSTAAFPGVIASATSEEKKGDDSHAANDAEGSAAAPVFLDINTATEHDRRIEADSWTLFKLPTRLPRIVPPGRVKSEAGGDGANPMQVESSGAAGGQRQEQHQRYPGAPTPANRFDDSLRSAPSGRYGKIRIRKSGKAVLVVGEGTAEEVILDLNEGIPCSMMQQAVNIDPIEGTYVTMGEIHRSIVATPDIASAFPFA